MTLELPERMLEQDLTIRPPVLADAEAAVALFNRCALSEIGTEADSIEELLNEWETPGFNMEDSTLAVFTQAGEMIAYAEVWDLHELPVRPNLYVRVHPDYREHGLESQMLRWALTRAEQAIARCPADARVVAQTWFHESAADSHQTAKQLGFFTQRQSYQMLIEMTEAPPAPVWPEGITLQTFDQFQDVAAVYRAHVNAFQDHRGFVPQSFEVGLERFKHWMLSDAGYDPTLWFLALDGAEVAGYALCVPKAWDDKDKGFVDILGVCRSYRRQGLALALLHHTFGEFWKRGTKKVGLGVDGTSITNAVALYERAGMRVLRRYDLYETELRPGVEYSKQ